MYETGNIGYSGKKKIQHLLYRCTQAGGSTTLVTRAAGISWVKMQMSSANTKDASILAAIAKKLYDTCDQDRVDRWSGGQMKDIVEEIQKLRHL